MQTRNHSLILRLKHRGSTQGRNPADALEYYISSRLTVDVFKKEQEDRANILHLIYPDGIIAGDSKKYIQQTFLRNR